MAFGHRLQNAALQQRSEIAMRQLRRRLRSENSTSEKVVRNGIVLELHPALELHKITLLGLPPGQQALITGGNAARLLGLRQNEARRAALRAPLEE